MGLEVMAHVATTGDVCPDHQCLVFKPFLLDLRDERLWKGAKRYGSARRSFAVLRCLLMQAGQLVTKETLLETVWPETVVGEAVLTVVIRELRQRLGIRRISHSSSRPCVGGDIGLLPRSRWRRSLRIEREIHGRHSSPSWLRLDLRRARDRSYEYPMVHEGTPGERQMGFIAGEPGIGKTALVDMLWRI